MKSTMMYFLAVTLLCASFSVLSAASPYLEYVTAKLDCPLDSIRENGVCVCDFDKCVKPNCDKILNVIEQESPVPGSCCPIYSCDPCTTETILAGNCSCAPNAYLDRTGKCLCSDPEKSVQNGECVCDVNKCPLEHICDSNSVKVREKKDCCMVTVCKTCPSDSHAYIYNDGQIEDKCVCFPCPKPSCPDNQILINKRKGQNIPGACCDLYECSNRSCLVQGKSINHNETFMSKSMPGVECICKNGVSMCTSLEKPEEQKQDPKMPCFSGEKIYSHQDTWMEDSCTNCTCINGKPKCISHFCIVKTEFKKMCPSMSNCTKTCDAGYKQNKNGCEICKCREDPNNKYIKLTNLIQLLKELNLSESDAIDIIKEHMLSKHTNPTANNICQNNIYFSIFACVVLVIFLIGVGIYKCHNMEFSYSPMNIKKKKTVKTCELQHFTTGDNKLSTIH